jgi:hypothetical protein
MELDGTLLILCKCIFALMALIVVVRYFRYLPEHAEQRRERDELRRRLVKKRTIPADAVLFELDSSGKITEKIS